MEQNYAIHNLKWALYNYYYQLCPALALYQLIEADYNLNTYTSNIRAIEDYVHFICNTPPQKLLIAPDSVHEDHINRNPRKGIIYKTLYLGNDLYVEIKHPRYNRSRAQLDLEDRIRSTTGNYMVGEGFADLLQQLAIWIAINHSNYV